MHAKKRIWGAFLLASALLLVTAGGVLAGKPTKPDPDPGVEPVDSGTIYIMAGAVGPISAIDTDGSNPTATGFTGYRPPSTAPHAGERWFLELRPLDGEYYDSGYVRHELFAATPSGAAVQLTNDPNVEPVLVSELDTWTNYPSPGAQEQQCMRWATADGVVDGKVSYVAARRVDGEIVECGIYVVELDPDDLFDGSEPEPASYGNGGSFLPVDVPYRIVPGTIEDTDQALVWLCYDWAPDGEAIAYVYHYYGDPSGLMVAQADDAWVGDVLLEGYGYYTSPRWSPDGSVIAFEATRERDTYPYTTTDIHTIEPDGTDEALLVEAGEHDTLCYPDWSPSGDYLVYTVILWPKRPPNKGTAIPESRDVYRVAADGSGAVNLTTEGDTWYFAREWVADE